MKPCNGCPFNDGVTLEATQAQNYGCLPTAQEMMEHFDNKKISISCHGKLGAICRGLLRERPEAEVHPIRDYCDWYQKG